MFKKIVKSDLNSFLTLLVAVIYNKCYFQVARNFNVLCVPCDWSQSVTATCLKACKVESVNSRLFPETPCVCAVLRSSILSGNHAAQTGRSGKLDDVGTIFDGQALADVI